MPPKRLCEFSARASVHWVTLLCEQRHLCRTAFDGLSAKGFCVVGIGYRRGKARHTFRNSHFPEGGPMGGAQGAVIDVTAISDSED